MEKTRGVCRVFWVLLPVLCFLAVPVRSQTVQAPTGFVMNVNRPFVYVKFDHIGPGVARSKDEPNLRIWLRLTNNCRIAILVQASGVPDESPEDEVGVQYEVVRNPEISILPLNPREEKTTIQEKPKAAELPRGTMFHVASLVSIEPGNDILFSVPVNHLSDKWHIEIPFEFELPKGKGPRDPNNGGIPVMVLHYSLWDLPPKSRAEIVKK